MECDGGVKKSFLGWLDEKFHPTQPEVDAVNGMQADETLNERSTETPNDGCV